MEKINIISSSRTGSSYLFNLIRSGIDDSNYTYYNAEPFNDTTNFSTCSNIIDLAISPSYVALLKNHYFQLENLHDRNKELFEKFWSANWKNILIIRRNIFEQALSLALAKTTKSYVPYSNNNVKIKINQKLFDKSLKDCIDRNSNIIENKLKINYSNTIFYEDLVLDTINVVTKLNIKSVNLKKIHLENKLLMHDKRSVVKNYDILKDYARQVINNTENLVNKI